MLIEQQIFMHADLELFECTGFYVVQQHQKLFAFIAHRLGACRDRHAKRHLTTSQNDCHRKELTNDTVPIAAARIIEIGARGTAYDIRLVSANNLDQPYVALSYCWGIIPSLRTTKDTLHAHEQAVSLDALPRILRDAVDISYRLGFHYLWIDALCIIQDDEEDWEREAAKMVDVYRSATLTVVAAAASDSSEGCLVEAGPEATRYLEVKNAHVDLPEHFTLIPARPHFRGNVEKSTWNARAWTMQERLLSRRIAYFAKDQVYWECNEESVACDRGGMDLVRHPGELIMGTQESWFHLVKDYTTRKLTRESDKLVAIAGLAEIRRGSTNDVYYYGLWRSGLHQGLLWYAHDESGYTTRILPRYNIPTWSWAGMRGQILRESWATDARPSARVDVQDRMLCLRTKARHVALTQPLRRLQDDRQLELRATSAVVYDIRLRNKSLALMPADDRPQAREIGWAALDEPNEAASGQEYLAAVVSLNDLTGYEQDEEGEATWNVLLLSKCGAKEAFVRVGIGEVIVKDYFDDVEESCINVA